MGRVMELDYAARAERSDTGGAYLVVEGLDLGDGLDRARTRPRCTRLPDPLRSRAREAAPRSGGSGLPSGSTGPGGVADRDGLRGGWSPRRRRAPRRGRCRCPPSPSRPPAGGGAGRSPPPNISACTSRPHAARRSSGTLGACCSSLLIRWALRIGEIAGAVAFAPWRGGDCSARRGAGRPRSVQDAGLWRPRAFHASTALAVAHCFTWIPALSRGMMESTSRHSPG